MKKIFSILIVLMFILSVSLVSANENITDVDLETDLSDESYEVQNEIDTTSELLSASDNSDIIDDNDNVGKLSELADKISNAGSYEVIDLDKDYIYLDTDLGINTINVNTPLTINGNNHFIELGSAVFKFNRDIILNNITFKNSHIDDRYNSIEIGSGVQAEIRNCNFINNTNPDTFLINSKGVCTVRDTNFINNTADTLIWGDNSFGNILNSNFTNNIVRSAAIYYSGNFININNCSFTNTAGTAISLSSTNTFISKSKFVNNTKYGISISYWGAITTEITDSLFVNPTLMESRGAIDVGGYTGSVLIDNITVKNHNVSYGSPLSNGAEDLTITNSLFENNVGSYSGAISNRGSLKLSNSKFYNNIGENAGALYADGFDFLLLKNNTMVNNVASPDSSDIYCSIDNYNNPAVDSFYLTVYNNQTIYSDSPVEVYAILTDDMGNLVSGPDFVFQVNGANLSSSKFNTGKATSYVTPLIIGENILSGVIKDLNDNIILKSATIISQKEFYKGPYYVSVNGDDSNKGDKNNPFKTIQNAVIHASLSPDYKQVIITEGNYLEHDINVTIGDVEIIGEGNVVIDANNLGRAFNVNKNLNMSNVKIINGKSYMKYEISSVEIENILENKNSFADGFGGAILIVVGDALINFDNVTFENNKATVGGAIFIYTSRNYFESILNLNNVNFNNNIANQSGGAIYSNFEQLNVYDSKFYNNQALKNLTGKGGAIFANHLFASNSVFDNNKASFGGSLYASELEVENSNFTNNNAIYGGAVFSHGMYGSNNLISNSSGLKDKGLYIDGAYYNGIITVLDNKTIETDLNSYDVHVTFSDDMGNLISGGYIVIYLDGFKVISLPAINGTVNTKISLSPGLNCIYANSAFISGWSNIYLYENYGDYVKYAVINSNSNPYDGPFYVSPDGDDSASGDINNPLKSLNVAIDLASKTFGSKKVIMKEGHYYLHDIEIFNDIEIIGEGNVIIDAQGKGRIFKIDTQHGLDYNEYLDVKLANLTLINGDASKVSDFDKTYMDSLKDYYKFYQVNYDLGYGGAIYSNSPIVLENITFINNYANMGGAIFSNYLEASNIEFINNDAINYPDAVYRDQNSQVPDDFELINKITITDENVFTIQLLDLPFKYDGYMVFSTQELPYMISYGYLTDALNFYLNNYNGEDVLDYLKILMFNHRNETAELQKAIWIFTDGQYWESTHPWVIETLNQYNKGELIANNGTITLANGTEVKYDFKGIFAPNDDIIYYSTPNKDILRAGRSLDWNEQSNFILLKYSQNDYNLTVNKETVNKTVKVNDLVEFIITISNKGNTSINNSFIEDSDFDSSLEFVEWNSADSWTFDKTQMRWYLNKELKPDESAKISIIFKALNTGILRNNVTAGFNNVSIVNSTNTTNVTVENKTNTTNGTVENKTNSTPVDNFTNPEVNKTTNVKIPSKTVDNTPKVTVESKNIPKSNQENISDKATGNPILLLLLVILIGIPFRRKL